MSELKPLGPDSDVNFTGQDITPKAIQKSSHHKPVFSSVEVGDTAINDPVAAMLTEALQKSVENTMAGIRRGMEIVELGFKEDPVTSKLSALYKPKLVGVPNEVLKVLARTDDLLAAILNARSNHIATFGRELQDRFSTGFRIEPRKGVVQDLDKEGQKKLIDKIHRASKILSTCGFNRGFDLDHRMTLSTFLGEQTRNALLFGYFATEVSWATGDGGQREFRGFRPLDAGTIYAAQPNTDTQAEQIRRQAFAYLEKVNGKELTREPEADRDFAWFQVHHGRNLQSFTNDELIVTNIYPNTDIETGGYPITPIDTCIAAVTTHINITTHNKLYFQNGRAARGMIIIKSADVDTNLADSIKQHFNATANGVRNSWRVPIFGIDPNDSMDWVPIELQGGRDMEFQYLSDQNCRTILSAFQMSPEELPGYQHLSRGSNNQALSESNNEYKLLAARDVGIRPLLAHFQDFLNLRILPLVDEEVAKQCTLKFYGLDADTAEKEASRIAADAPLHMTYNEVLNRVEKDSLPEEMGANFPFNPMYQQILDKYFTVGEIKEFFFKVKGASRDPNWAYVRDEFWFSWQQTLQAAMQAAQQTQDPSQQPGPDNGNDEPPTEGDSEESALKKAEHQLAQNQKRVLAAQSTFVKATMSDFKRNAAAVREELMRVTRRGRKKS